MAVDDGVDRQMASDHSSGIDAVSELNPSCGPPCLKKFHHGKPFCVIMSIVEGVTIEATYAAIGVS